MGVAEKFIDYLSFQKGYSQLTCLKYSEILSLWMQWWSQQSSKPPWTESPCPAWQSESLQEYFYYLRSERSYQASSLAQTISCFKSLDHWLLSQGVITQESTSHIKSPKLDQKIVDFISQDVLDQEVQIEELKGKDLRQWCVFEVFYASGMRLAELHGLNWSDISWSPLQAKVLGKGNKERLVPLTQRAAKLLTTLALEQGLNPDSSSMRSYAQSPFLNPKGERISQRTLQKDIQSLLQSFGWQGKASPHMLRHSFATHMMENGAEILTVKELMGHSSIQSTQVYTHVSQDQVLKNYQQAHPRAKRKG